MAKVNLLERGETWIAVNATGFTSVSSYVNFYCVETGKTLSTSSWYTDAGIYTGRVTFTGLTPGASYTITGRVYWSATGSSPIDQLNTSTIAPTPIPNPYSWSWTTTERYALDNKGLCSTITYQRWNEFCEQVRLTTIWYWGYEKYDFNSAKMSANSKTMTATRFRIIRDAIGSMNSTGITDDLIQTGRTVYGWYFVRLSERFNSITKTSTYSIGTMEQLYNMDALMISAKLEDINKEVKNGDK